MNKEQKSEILNFLIGELHHSCLALSLVSTTSPETIEDIRIAVSKMAHDQFPQYASYNFDIKIAEDNGVMSLQIVTDEDKIELLKSALTIVFPHINQYSKFVIDKVNIGAIDHLLQRRQELYKQINVVEADLKAICFPSK